MSRADDLWSMFYLLIEFIRGALPWRQVGDKNEVCKMKEQIGALRLIDGMPGEMQNFVEHLESLGYYDEPNYEMLVGCLRSILNRIGVKDEDPFDWEKPREPPEPVPDEIQNMEPGSESVRKMKPGSDQIRKVEPVPDLVRNVEQVSHLVLQMEQLGVKQIPPAQQPSPGSSGVFRRRQLQDYE